MTGRLTTHVLELSCGRPAVGMRVELYRLSAEGERTCLLECTTNTDGRVDRPLLEGEALLAGVYELVFHVAAFYSAQRAGESKAEAGKEEITPFPFLDQVPIRFGVRDTGSHYHVPLLVAPGGYSTYRGS